MAPVSLSHLIKSFAGGVRAVDDVSVDVRDGEFLVLVGPSGCGKSTTLRMVAGLEEADSGDIRIGDRVVNAVAPKDRDIAMVFQNYALYPHMTVYRNLAFGLALRKTPKDEIDRRVREAARILGIQELLDRKPKALSGGQRQRVALGRAIVRKPAVFLFDEPLSNLDAQLRVQMRAEINRLHTQLAATMIYVTHDQIEAMTLGDRIAVMRDGKIQQLDTPQAVYDEPANLFVAGFLGSPPMNFLRGQVRGASAAAGSTGSSALEFAFGAASLTLPTALASVLGLSIGHEVVLGIRPEDISTDSAAAQGGVGGGAGAHAAEYASLDAEVQIVEPMGAEMHLHLKAGDATLIARVHVRATVKPGDRMRLLLNMAHAKFFDPATGIRL